MRTSAPASTSSLVTCDSAAAAAADEGSPVTGSLPETVTVAANAPYVRLHTGASPPLHSIDALSLQARYVLLMRITIGNKVASSSHNW
jgi:hypothetical protein